MLQMLICQKLDKCSEGEYKQRILKNKIFFLFCFSSWPSTLLDGLVVEPMESRISKIMFSLDTLIGWDSWTGKFNHHSNRKLWVFFLQLVCLFSIPLEILKIRCRDTVSKKLSDESACHFLSMKWLGGGGGGSRYYFRTLKCLAPTREFVPPLSTEFIA